MPTDAPRPDLAEMKARLKPLVAACVRRSATPSFRLRSGKLSDFYFDGRLVALRAESLALVAAIILRLLEDEELAAIGGPSIGADPLIGAVVALSAGTRRPLTGFMIRKEAKEHGLGQRIEGPRPPAGSAVVLIEDVVTTGGSTLEALAAVRAEFPDVVCRRAFCLVDRLEGGAEALARENLTLTPLFTRRDFPVTAGEAP